EPVEFATILVPKWARQFLFETLHQFLRADAFAGVALANFTQRLKEGFIWIGGWILAPFPRMGCRFGTAHGCIARRCIAKRCIAKHGSEHVKQPGSAFVADGLVASGEMGRIQALAQRDRSGVTQPLSIFVLAHEVLAVLFQDVVKLRRILLLEQQKRGVVCQTFRNPLVAIAFPEHQVAPPLMRRFMDENPAVEFTRHGIEMEVGLFLRTEKRETGKKDQAWPSLAQLTWHLG